MTMITRCPACETAFRITEAQLNTAKGAVRCGSCLQIFRAMDNLVPARGTEPAASTAAPLKGKVTAVADADMPRFEYRRPAAAPRSAPQPAGKPGSAQPPQSSPAREDLAPAAPPAQRQPPSVAASEPDYESSWQYQSLETSAADAGQENMLRFDQKAIDADDDGLEEDIFSDELLISDDLPLGDEEQSRSSQLFGDDLSENFLELDGWKMKGSSLFDREPKPPTQDDDEVKDTDESWALSLLEDEDEADLAPPVKSTLGGAPGPAHEAQQDAAEDLDIAPGQDYESYSPANTGRFGALSEADIEAAAPAFEKSATRDNDPGSRGQFDAPDAALDEVFEEDFSAAAFTAEDRRGRSALLSSIEPEPVEFTAYGGRNWRRALLWGGLSLLGVLLLVTQIAWLQFDRLSRLQPYRDIYASVCPLLGCHLPPLAAPELIRTSNLVVRSHPQASGALMVDTILLNTASFQQPFPDLVLSFSNIHGEVLASRRFNPEEYLGGELAGRREMPSNQPVHLSLEIQDPGPDAVNYSAHIPQ